MTITLYRIYAIERYKGLDKCTKTKLMLLMKAEKGYLTKMSEHVKADS